MLVDARRGGQHQDRSHTQDPDGGAQPRCAAHDRPEIAQARLLPVAGLLGTLPPLRRDRAVADPLGGTEVEGSITEALRRRRGSGQRLPDAVADPMGQHLGIDVSTLRVHSDSEAGSIARSVQANAFTYGNDIYFATGSYQPSSAAGQRVLAHELSHVAAQRSGDDGGTAGPLSVGRADDPAETAADRSADRVLGALRRSRSPEHLVQADVDRVRRPGPGQAAGPLAARRKAHDPRQTAVPAAIRRYTGAGTQSESGSSPTVIRRVVKLNADAEQGLSPEDKEFVDKKPTRQEFEAWLADAKKDEKREILGMWDSSGQLTHVNVGKLALSGEAPAVKLPGARQDDKKSQVTSDDVEHDSIEVRKDAVVTHSHPSGSALSKGDVAAAMDSDLAEIRAVGRFGWYSLRRPDNGWQCTEGRLADLGTLFAKTSVELWKAEAAKLDVLKLPKSEKKTTAFREKIAIKDWRVSDPMEMPLLAGETFAEDMFMQKFCFAQALQGAGYGTFETNVKMADLVKERLKLYEPRAARGSDKRAGQGFSL